MSQKPLYDASAEQSLLGALLLSNAAWERIDGKIAASDFFYADYRRMFVEISRLIGDGKPADVVTVSAALQGDDIGDPDWMETLGELLQAVPTAAHIEQYARIIRDHRIERDLANAAESMGLLAHGIGPVHERLDEAQKLVTLLTETANTHEACMIGDVLGDVITSIEAAHENGGRIPGLPTGIGKLDERIGGLQGGLLYIVAARPSMGKTALAINIAEEAADRSGNTAMVFSMEMSKTQLAKRALSRAGKIRGDTLRDGRMQGDDWERLSMAVGKLKDMRMLIDDSSALSVDQIRSRARRAHRRTPLACIVVDYLQLMSGRGDNREQEIALISRSLKNLARELGIPVIALSQLSRKPEERTNKRPIMSDLRESGAIEQDADVIIFIYRDEYYNENSEAKGIAELNVAKQRDGETGVVYATFVGEYSHFADTEYVHREPTRETKSRDMTEDFKDARNFR